MFYENMLSIYIHISIYAYELMFHLCPMDWTFLLVVFWICYTNIIFLNLQYHAPWGRRTDSQHCSTALAKDGRSPTALPSNLPCATPWYSKLVHVNVAFSPNIWLIINKNLSQLQNMIVTNPSSYTRAPPARGVQHGSLWLQCEGRPQSHASPSSTIPNYIRF